MDIPKIEENFPYHFDIEIQRQQEIFSQTYKVEVLTKPEREKVLNPFIVDAKLALKWLVESNHISIEKAEEVLNIWNNAIIVDNNGAKRLGDYHAEPYLDMYKKIKDSTPDNFIEKVTQENIEDLKKAAVATVELIHHEYENSGAIIFQPYIDPSIQTKQGLSDKIIVINKDHLDKYSGHLTHYIRAISHEETLHLANNLDKYGKPFNEIWVNEMMTKIVAISLATINKVDVDILNSQMTLVRFNDFARLYNLVTEQDEGNGRLLLEIYFGKANRNHPLFERLSELLYKYNALGSLLNITNIENIQKGVEEMIQI